MTPIGSPSHSRATYKGERLSVWFLVSLIPFGLSVVLFAASYRVDPTKTRISLGDNFHVSLLVRRDIDARIVFFNNAGYGPYQGSLVAVGAVGSPPQEYPKRVGFGDWLGIYYRHFRWPDEVLWTLSVSLWYPMVFFALCALIAWWRWKRRLARVQSVASD